MAFCASGSGAATIVTGMARVVATQQHEEGESAEQRQKNRHGQHAKRREQGRHQTSAAAADIPGSFGRDMEPQCARRALGLVDDVRRPQQWQRRQQHHCGAQAERDARPERDEGPTCCQGARDANHGRNRLRHADLGPAGIMVSERSEIGVVGGPVESISERGNHTQREKVEEPGRGLRRAGDIAAPRGRCRQ